MIYLTGGRYYFESTYAPNVVWIDYSALDFGQGPELELQVEKRRCWTALRCRSGRCKGKRQPHRPQHTLQRGERRIPLPRKRAIERLPVQLGGFGHGPEAAVRVGHAAERQQELLLRPLERRREVRGGQFRIAQALLAGSPRSS